MLASVMDFMCPSVPAFSHGQINLEEADRTKKKLARGFVTFSSFLNDLIFQMNYSML